MELLAATGIASGLVESLSLLPVLAVLVIFFPLLRVTNNLVCLVQGLELGLGLRVIGMKIWMKLLCTFQKCAPNVLLGNVAVNTKNFIIIDKCQSRNPPFRYSPMINKNCAI